MSNFLRINLRLDPIVYSERTTIKVLFYDTESTSLEASWGRVLCCSFVVLDRPNEITQPWTLRGDKRPFKNKHDIVDDSKLVMAIRDELETADIIVSWNGILHDEPLLNARLARVGERPIQIGTKYGSFDLDFMYYVRGSSMKIGGSKLDTAAKYFKLPVQKTPLDGECWQRAGAGDKKAMDQIQQHCEHDVLVLRESWKYLAPMVQKVQFNLSEVYPFIHDIPSRKHR